MAKSIKVYNELIAEFMKYERDKLCYFIPKHAKVNSRGEWIDTFPSEHLKFHKSWDWLVPVLEKIFSLPDYQEYADVKYQLSRLDLDATHKAAVKFIEWFNKKQWENEYK